ncbi:hypothetical protein [Deinococcus sp.]|uniref:hypothetical protein n=1 Tax=Deinococcus sp. TaxID=47478 RepID=UPI0025C2F0A6|nr:hypothetical protein [Deinococcus sp.]
MKAAFSEQGVAWVADGRACVARKPDYAPFCPRLGRASDVAWNGGDAWAALPGVGLVITLDRAAQSVYAGAVVALSARHIYREDGSALTYSGSPAGQIAGTPTRVTTGGDGQDYVVLNGELRRFSDNALIDPAPLPHLLPTSLGVQGVGVPTVVTDNGTYRLSGAYLERLDNGGAVIARVADDALEVGAVGQDILTVSALGKLRHFSGSLQEF